MSVYKKGNKWYCQFMVNNKRTHKYLNGATTKKDAENLETALKYELMQQIHGIKKQDERFTFSFMMKLYTTTARAKGCSLKEPTYFSSFFINYFGASTNILDITPNDVKLMMIHIVETMHNSVATANRYRSALRRAYNIMIKDGYITYNPVSSTEPYLEDNVRQRYLTHKEWKLLKEVLPEYARQIILFDLYTGFRLKNVLLCKWEYFDFNLMHITITRSTNKGKKLIYHPISAGLYKLLEEIGIKESGYVFVNPKTNKPYTRITKSLYNACKKANIKDFHFHDLRRTVGTWLLEENVDIRTIQEILWHSDISTTQRYLSISSKRSKDAVEILSSLL